MIQGSNMKKSPVLQIFHSLLAQRSMVWNQSRLSVCERSHGWTVWRTDPKFGGGIYLDNISDELEGRSNGSRVKVARLKNTLFEVSDGLVIWRHTMTPPFGKTLTEGMVRQARQCSGVFITHRLIWAHDVEPFNSSIDQSLALKNL